MLYWPIAPGAPKPDAATLARIDAYMKQGGTIVFDTRDALTALPVRGGEVSPALAKLREILSALDIPELEPVPPDHVLTKSFYLLRDFPGRYGNGRLWVEALPGAERGEEARPGARRRRRLADPDHVERSRRRLGHRPRRPAALAAHARRAAPARVRLPRRRQHRDVRAHRQLQGRSGARAGAARTARAMNFGVAFEPLISLPWLTAAAVVAMLVALLPIVSRARGAWVRALAILLALIALANPFLYPRRPRAALFGRRRRHRQEREPALRRPREAPPRPPASR